jgi:hypothetical protein
MGRDSKVVPGFRPLTGRISICQGDIERQSDDHPDTIVIFAWGDSSPKHVAKYAEGFRSIFPGATQVVVLSAIVDVLYSTKQQRSIDFQPLIDLLSKEDSSRANPNSPSRILIHCMSNTGGICYSSLLQEFQTSHGRPLPHGLIVLDSTPGSPDLSWFNLQRWSKAMALGTAAWFPWPFAVTQSIWGLFLCALHGVEWLMGRKSAATVATTITNETAFEVKTARRLYLYSKEDDLIFWKDIENHAAMARSAGYSVDSTMFEGSGHVSHMRTSPEQYWSAIEESWHQSQQ